MGLYKEGNHFLMRFANTQGQIYPDACDVGIFVDGPDHPIWRRISEGLTKEYLFGGLKKTRTSYDNRSACSITIEINLPWEEYVDKDSYRCSSWRITYYNDKIRKIKYFSFDVDNSIKTTEEIWEKTQ